MFAVVSFLFLLLGGARAVRLRPLLDEVDGHLAANFRNVSEAVLLIGAPATGKTSLAMLLAVDASLRTDRTPSGILLLSDGARKVGRDTFLPNFMRDDVLGTVLVDCPAPTEPEEAVVAAEYAILRTVSRLSRVKVLLVENAFSFADGGDKEGGRRARELAKRFGPVAAVVASKGDSKGDFIEKGVAGIGAPVIEFPRPFRPGSPLDTMQATATSVRKAIAGSEWRNLKPTMSKGVSCYINEMLTGVLKETKKEFEKLLVEVKERALGQIEAAENRFLMATSVNSQIGKLSDLNYSSLAAELKRLNSSSDRLDFLAIQLNWAQGLGFILTPLDLEDSLQNITDKFFKIQQLYKFVHESEKLLRNYKVIKRRENITGVLEDHPLENLVLSMAAMDLRPRPQLLEMPLLDWMKKDLNAALREKLKIPDWSNEGLAVAAPFVLLSEAAKKFLTFNKSIVLMASQVIFLDQNILIDDGKDLIIIAPEVQVVKENMTLAMKGRDGATFEEGAQEGDGKAGEPGGPAGNLLIFCTKITDAENLLVKSVGGEGGAGQQGASAIQGVFQPEEALEFLEPSTNIMSSRNKTSGKLRLAYREERTPVKKAGNGGVGGEGGLPGSVIIFTKDEEVNVVRTEEEKGQKGAPGKGGEGAEMDSKFTFTIAECEEGCVQVATGQSVAVVPPLEAGLEGNSTLGLQEVVQPTPLALRRYLYLYVGTILSKEMGVEEEAQVVSLVEKLPNLIRKKGGPLEGGVEQLEAEWAVMEREEEGMKEALGRHLPLMHHLLLAYADTAPGGRHLSELIRKIKQN